MIDEREWDQTAIITYSGPFSTVKGQINMIWDRYPNSISFLNGLSNGERKPHNDNTARTPFLSPEPKHTNTEPQS